jgi:hypothetical protein
MSLTAERALVVCAVLILTTAPCWAAREPAAPESHPAIEPASSTCDGRADELFGVRGETDALEGRGFRSVGEETLWIFDADFEDLMGDNAGWTSLDMSGTLAVTNYWHKDTIRINGFTHLGDSTWWCGTYNDCWCQPRGYGNDWLCSLAREFPLSEWSNSDDTVTFEFDQRYAMELSYDYGYTDVSTDGGETWTTLWTQTNAGFAGTPGISSDWDSAYPSGGGHMALDLSEFAGLDIFVRYRFESDGAYSSQDQYDSSGTHPVLDGAWQLDNFCFKINGDVVWLDDCESPGDNGWVHDNIPGSGQTGVVFERVLAPDILRDDYCYWWCPSGWWMAALDAETGRMVDGQNSWLLSPPIDISGTEFLVGQWDAWMDLGSLTNDFYDIYLSAGDDSQCIMEHSSFVDAWTQWPHIGPHTARETADWDLWAPSDWLVINWRLWNDDPAEPGVEHWTGLMLDRQRVGVPVGGPPTRWDYGAWNRFHDTFDMAEALEDTAWIRISDWDGIVSAYLVVSSDAGETWESSPMVCPDPETEYWKAAPPVGHIAPATEIRYYFESTDGAGNVRTHPRSAPNAYYEFSILPILGSVADSAILLVDKHGRVIRNEDGEFRQTSERYFREALDVLGFEYDVYDVEVPSGSTDQSNGPDSAGYKYYDTQIWFTNDFNAYTVKPFDQINLISWLSQAEQGKERNLLLTGNEIGEELIGYGTDTLDFYSEWLASEYLLGDVASTGDTSLVLRDEGGDFEFMTHGDRACPLRLLEWDYG